MTANTDLTLVNEANHVGVREANFDKLMANPSVQLTSFTIKEKELISQALYRPSGFPVEDRVLRRYVAFLEQVIANINASSKDDLKAQVAALLR